jgi:hypothetical protein
MKTYVACIGEEAVWAFRAENDDDAHAMIDDEEGSIRSDLNVLVGTDEKPLWAGSPLFGCEKRPRHNKPSGSSSATKQSATKN